MRSVTWKLVLALLIGLSSPRSQTTSPGSSVWTPDQGDGTYRNPIIYADYSDPDVIRVGDDFYMTASSFSHFPGLPILHSKDLVNWTIIGHAAPEYPSEDFNAPQHGKAIWAPAIRYHNGEYHIYVGDPDRGIFMTKAKHPAGPWQKLQLVRKVTGWIDPCPLWDDDGNAYLVHAFANSRVGIKSILAVNRMNNEGTQILDDGYVVFIGHLKHPTIEGPKFYKRNGWYYIFAPAGGVKPGWQTVLRSKNVFGPYEDKVVLEQGTTKINGPHQGAWVTTQTGEDWFVHFQDRYAYGRIVHLQPMRWEQDWPVMGVDVNGNGIGEPVTTYRKPGGTTSSETLVPQTSDEFDSARLGLQWQWQANPQRSWISLSARPGWLRFRMQELPDSSSNIFNVAALLMQKLPAPAFSATAKLEIQPAAVGDRAGIVLFGLDYATLSISKSEAGYCIVQSVCARADKGSAEQSVESAEVTGAAVYLRIAIRPENEKEIIPKVLGSFSYSVDGKRFRAIGKEFVAREGVWVGAKVGLFAIGAKKAAPSGHADVDWFRFEPSGK